MGFITGTILLVIFIIVCKKMSMFFFRAAEYFDERKRHRTFQERCLKDISESLLSAFIPPEETSRVDYTTRLLRANQEILEKDKLETAMEQELGIKTYGGIYDSSYN
jgi:hypothetical protein